MTARELARREFLARAASTAGLALGGCGLLAACGPDTVLARARQRGSLAIGVADRPPYAFTTERGGITGEGPEVARAVLESLGVESVTAHMVDVDGLLPALNRDRFDMVCVGMFVTPKRCARAAFSIPDYVARQAFLVPEGNPKKVTRYEDVAARDLTLAVPKGGVERGYALRSGVPETNLQVLPTLDALLRAVVEGRAYCAAHSDIAVNYVAGVRHEDAAVEATPAFAPVLDGEEVVDVGGFVFRPEDDELRTAFNAGLHDLQRSGRWLQIAQRFGFSAANLPPVGLTTAQLCAS